jgi:hypothetical protein
MSINSSDSTQPLNNRSIDQRRQAENLPNNQFNSNNEESRDASLSSNEDPLGDSSHNIYSNSSTESNSETGLVESTRTDANNINSSDESGGGRDNLTDLHSPANNDFTRDNHQINTNDTYENNNQSSDRSENRTGNESPLLDVMNRLTDYVLRRTNPDFLRATSRSAALNPPEQPPINIPRPRHFQDDRLPYQPAQPDIDLPVRRPANFHAPTHQPINIKPLAKADFEPSLNRINENSPYYKLSKLKELLNQPKLKKTSKLSDSLNNPEHSETYKEIAQLIDELLSTDRKLVQEDNYELYSKLIDISHDTDTKLLEKLVDAGIKATDEKNNTYLQQNWHLRKAAAQGKVKVFKHLLKVSAKKIPDLVVYSPLTLLLENKPAHISLKKLASELSELLNDDKDKRFGSFNRAALFREAILDDDLDTMRYMLDELKYNVNDCIHGTSDSDFNAFREIYLSNTEDRAKMLKLLIEKGVNLKPEPDYEDPLYLAVDYDALDALETLCQQPSSAIKQQPLSANAFNLAISDNKLSAAKLLLIHNKVDLFKSDLRTTFQALDKIETQSTQTINNPATKIKDIIVQKVYDEMTLNGTYDNPVVILDSINNRSSDTTYKHFKDVIEHFKTPLTLKFLKNGIITEEPLADPKKILVEKLKQNDLKVVDEILDSQAASIIKDTIHNLSTKEQQQLHKQAFKIGHFKLLKIFRDLPNSNQLFTLFKKGQALKDSLVYKAIESSPASQYYNSEAQNNNLKYLIENGYVGETAIINYQDPETGNTMLHEAALSTTKDGKPGDINTFMKLINSGADLAYPNKAGETPLMLAARSSPEFLAELLSSDRFDDKLTDRVLNATNNQDDTVAHMIAKDIQTAKAELNRILQKFDTVNKDYLDTLNDIDPKSGNYKDLSKHIEKNYSQTLALKQNIYKDQIISFDKIIKSQLSNLFKLKQKGSDLDQKNNKQISVNNMQAFTFKKPTLKLDENLLKYFQYGISSSYESLRILKQNANQDLAYETLDLLSNIKPTVDPLQSSTLDISKDIQNSVYKLITEGNSTMRDNYRNDFKSHINQDDQRIKELDSSIAKSLDSSPENESKLNSLILERKNLLKAKQERLVFEILCHAARKSNFKLVKNILDNHEMQNINALDAGGTPFLHHLALYNENIYIDASTPLLIIDILLDNNHKFSEDVNFDVKNSNNTNLLKSIELHNQGNLEILAKRIRQENNNSIIKATNRITKSYELAGGYNAISNYGNSIRREIPET